MARKATATASAASWQEMYKQREAGGVGLDRKRINDALDKHLAKAVAVAASLSTSMGSTDARGDHDRLVMPSSVPKGAALKVTCSPPLPTQTHT